jgi:flagellar protein FliT
MMLTIAAMPSQIDLYQQMNALSARMVEAARANDWDQLIDLERNVAALRDTLMAEDGNEALAPDEVEQKRRLIQNILQDDAEVRRHTEPWMEHVRRFLGGDTRKRQVDQAYGINR